MSTSSVDFLWTLIIGTMVLLLLAIIIIASVMASHRQQVQVQREKLRALQESEQVLRESEKKYRTLVESMEEAVFVVDVSGKILFTNTRFTQLIRSTKGKIIGKKLPDVFPGKETDKLMNCLDRVFATWKGDKTEHQFKMDYDSYWFETTLVPQFDRERNIVSVLGISRDMTERRKMEDQLKDLVVTLRSQQETLKSLSSEVIRAQEAERQRISRELHDEIGQALTAISLNLEMIKQQHTGERKDLTIRITDCRELVEKTMGDIHRFSYELRPSMLDDLGLLPAMQSHGRSFIQRTGIDVNISGSQSVENLDNEMKTVLYRVFQEGLNNIAKHADAHSVDIDISKQGGIISLQISDDGKGFDVDKLPSVDPGKGGLGLQGIRERVSFVGGHLSLVSKPGAGTTLIVDIPYGEA